MGFKKQKREFFNTKIMTYRDGRQKICYANKAIFSDQEPYQGFVPDQDPDLAEYQNDIYSDIQLPGEEQPPKDRKGDKEDKERSFRRAVQKVYDIAYMNDFRYFLTLTFDQKRYNNREAKEILDKVQNFLKHSVSRKGLAYVMTAERHKKTRGIHLHLLANDAFTLEDSGTRLVTGYTKPVSLATIYRKQIPEDQVGKIVYNIPEWTYGFTTAIEIDGDPAALAQYMTKYMTKDAQKIFGKYYWSSRNLVRSPEVSYTNTSDYQDIPTAEYQFKFGLALKYTSDFTQID